MIAVQFNEPQPATREAKKRERERERERKFTFDQCERVVDCEIAFHFHSKHSGHLYVSLNNIGCVEEMNKRKREEQYKREREREVSCGTP